MRDALQQKKVCVLGLGSIGLPLAALLATSGYSVRGVDINLQTINKIKALDLPYCEPDIYRLV